MASNGLTVLSGEMRTLWLGPQENRQRALLQAPPSAQSALARGAPTPFWESPSELHARVGQPLPVGRVLGPLRFVASLLDAWKLDIASACALLGLEHHEVDVARALLSGVRSIEGRDLRDRIANLIRIRALLSELFAANLENENQWLRREQSALGGRSVLDLLLAGSMREMITAVEFVEYVAGGF